MTPLTPYQIQYIGKTDTPFLAVYPNIIKKNIQRLISLFPSTAQIRPHVKTHKCPQVIKLLLDAGITKFKCATIAEAEMIAIAGGQDVLLAYQPVGPKIGRFIDIVINYPGCTFSCLVDNETTVRHLSVAAVMANVQVHLFVDLNIGMNRTGTASNEEAVQLFQFCISAESVNVVGVHAYDGHLTSSNAEERLEQAETGFNTVRDLVNELAQAGFPNLRIVAGSTPTLQFYSRLPDVECSPGTFIYWDQHYQNLFPELGFETAALVITRIISRPSSTTACLDLGYKAIASEEGLDKRVDLQIDPKAIIITQSEEHLLIATGPDRLNVGDVVYGLPYHIGRTCNLYEKCAVVEQGKITEHWCLTARTRQINF